MKSFKLDIVRKYDFELLIIVSRWIPVLVQRQAQPNKNEATACLMLYVATVPASKYIYLMNSPCNMRPVLQPTFS